MAAFLGLGAVTSTTTCVAFTLTCLTDIPLVSTFGTFAAIVVFWNLFLKVIVAGTCLHMMSPKPVSI
ncbi:hypothetical protein T484DRAFT_1819489 [Baffinella frigidus]|nr:hypothetical protein T484DRAFT_1819489 [Cryptophyta sp. CCMP2293]